MALETGMGPEAADAESEQPLDPAGPAAAALDADLLAKLGTQAVAAQSRPGRSALLTALATTIVAGLSAVAAAGYTALHAEISGFETRLRAEIQDFRAEMKTILLDHTGRLGPSRIRVAAQPAGPIAGSPTV